MWILGVLLVLAVGIWLLFKKPNEQHFESSVESQEWIPGQRTKEKNSGERNAISKKVHSNTDDSLEDQIIWLKGIWEQYRINPTKNNSLPEWWSKPISKSQKKGLEKMNIEFSDNLLRGHANDLLGLFAAPTDYHKKVLRFFKVQHSKMNKTQARYAVNDIFFDDKKKEAWNKRPAEQIQKEFFRFFGLKVSKDLTFKGANLEIKKHRDALIQHKGKSLECWDSYSEIIDELTDSFDLYDIKKPTLASIRNAVDALVKGGCSYEGLVDEIDEVVDMLLEIKPELEA